MDKQRPLTDRQTEILKLIALGYSSRQISEMLHITSLTVDTQRTNIYRKLHLHSVVEAVWYAISNRLVKPEDYKRMRVSRSTEVANVALQIGQ